MSSISKRHTKLETDLHGVKTINLSCEGIEAYLHFSTHAFDKHKGRSMERGIQEVVIIDMFQRALNFILDLPTGSEFIVSSYDYRTSLVGSVHADGVDISIDFITAIDSPEPRTKKGNYLIYV